MEHPFTLSVGYAELSAADARRTPALLLSKADLALYEVKLRGKRGCLAYSEDLQLRVRTHLGFALQDISQHLPGAFLIYKADRVNDELLFANQEMVRFAGCTDLEDLLAFTDHSFRNLIHPDEREAVERSIWAQQDAQQDGTNDYVSFRLVKKDGTYLPPWGWLSYVVPHRKIVPRQQSLPLGGRWAGEAGSDEGHLPNGIGRAPTQPRPTQYHRSNPFAKQNSMRAAASLPFYVSARRSACAT